MTSPEPGGVLPPRQSTVDYGNGQSTDGKDVDPGNSGPDDFTEDLTDEEQRAVEDLLCAAVPPQVEEPEFCEPGPAPTVDGRPPLPGPGGQRAEP